MTSSKFKIQNFRFLSTMLAVWTAIGNIHAQTDSEIAQIDSISEVVVTGVRPVYNLSSPTPVQTLKARDLERVNSLSVADAIRYFSGVQIKDYGGIGGIKTVNIRSLGTQQMGVFYDGIQLGNAQNGQIDLGRFSLDNMESISLYNGQKSDIFQSAKDYGASGTIYLTSIKPKFAENEHTRLRVNFRTAAYQAIKTPLSYGLTNPSLLWEQKITNKINGSFSTEWLSSNGKYKFRYREVNNDGSPAWDTTDIRKNGDIETLRIEGSLNGLINGGEWNAKVYYYSSERGLPGSMVRNRFEYDGQRLWDKNLFAQGSFQKQFGKQYRFKASAKYAYDYMHYVNNDTASLFADNVYKQQEAYLSVINQYYILPYWSAALSSDFQYNQMDANLDKFSYPQRYTTLVALATALSLDWVKAQASVLGTMVQQEVKRNHAAPNESVLTPAFFLSVKPFRKNGLYLRAFYKEIFRMPTFNDLYYTPIGETVLKPEFTTQYNIGATYGETFTNKVFSRFSIQADIYYNTITNKIISSPTKDYFRWMMMNLDLVKVRGLDITADASWRIHPIYFTTRLAYTYQKAQDFSDAPDSYYGSQIPYTPWHSGSVVATAEYRSWGLNYSFIYTGERYNQKDHLVDNYVQPWYTSDLSLFKIFAWKTVELKITGEINNLFNQYYDVVDNYPMPGRNYRLTISLKI